MKGHKKDTVMNIVIQQRTGMTYTNTQTQQNKWKKNEPGIVTRMKNRHPRQTMK